jgi:hypothetical protein
VVVTVSPEPQVPPPGANLTFEAESGTVSAPFYVGGGYVAQDVQTTTLDDSGRAVYAFHITAAGYYGITTIVNAPGDGSNSFWVNVDAEPTDPAMICDVPVTSGFEARTCSWRGNGTFDANEFTPKAFWLSAGTHTLIIRGRESGVQLDRITICPAPMPQQDLSVAQPH